MQGAEPTFENQTEVVCWIEWSNLKVNNGVDHTACKTTSFCYKFSELRQCFQERSNFFYRDQMDTLYSLPQIMDALLSVKRISATFCFC